MCYRIASYDLLGTLERSVTSKVCTRENVHDSLRIGNRVQRPKSFSKHRVDSASHLTSLFKIKYFGFTQQFSISWQIISSSREIGAHECNPA